MKLIQSITKTLFTVFAVSMLLIACGGGYSDSDNNQGGSGANPIYSTLNCLERYEKIEENMNESQVVAILGEATYLTKLNGNLLGAGWNNVTYAGQTCALLVGFDRKGVYTKGVTDMTGRNSDFEPRFKNFRDDLGY
jgi:hypothetical protein